MRIFLAGCGLIGRKRIEAAKRLGFTDFTFYDLDPLRAKQFAQEFGGNFCLKLDLFTIDSADVALISVSHCDLSKIAIQFIERGKPVLIEKPGAFGLEQALQIKSANTKNIPISIGFNHRFHPAFQKAHEIFCNQDKHSLMFLRARYGHGGRLGYEKEWRAQRAVSGGGQLIDQGAHLIDLSRWFLGNLKLDYAHVPTLFWKMEVEDNAFLALKGDSDTFAWLHASWTEWKNIFSFELSNSKIKIEVAGLGGSYGTETLKVYSMLPGLGPPETTIYEYPFADVSWDLELQNFFRAVIGEEKIIGDLDDCIALHKIIDAAYKF